MRGEREFVGENLVRARKARKRTAISVARELGDPSGSLISHYEKNRKQPTPERVRKISSILGIPINFFYEQKEEMKKTVSYYRSISANTKSTRNMAEEQSQWLIKLVELIEVFIELPSVNFIDLKPPTDPEAITDDFVEYAAIEARKFWKLGEGPISNTVWLVENNGAVVVRRYYESQTFDGFSFWRDGRPYIFLAADKENGVRSRMDIAHELGHLILHRNIDRVHPRTPKSLKILEYQANRFAGAFQFPRNSFLKEVRKPSLETFRMLKPRWKLSIAMMLMQASVLEIITEKRADYLWSRLAKKKWKRKEPLDDTIIPEKPLLLKNALEVILEEQILNRPDILEALNLYHQDVELIAGLPHGFLNPKSGEVISLKSRIEKQKTLDKEHKKDICNTDTHQVADVIGFPSRHSAREN